MTATSMMGQMTIPSDARKLNTNVITWTVHGATDGPLLPEPSRALADWIATAAEILGYDPTTAGPVPHDPDVEARWQPWLDKVRPAIATEEMFAPWLDVMIEESEAYDPIAAEHWPAD